MVKNRLLIDGDILLYKFGHRQVSMNYNERQVYADIDDFIADLRRKTRRKDVLVCFTGDYNFRYTVLPSYKHNRKDLKKPPMYYIIKQYFTDTYDTMIKNTIEADDLLGILSGSNNIIATIDKDLKQIKGLHYNWNKDQRVRRIATDVADKFFYLQVLTGDPGDGYQGIPGIGIKRGIKIIKECTDGDYWKASVTAYEDSGLTEEDALIQARVARILRPGEYDLDTEEIRLWKD